MSMKSYMFYVKTVAFDCSASESFQHYQYGYLSRKIF